MTLYSAKIADLGKIVTGKTPSTKNKDNFGGNIPFITPVDMSYNRNVFSTERYVSSKGAESVKGCILPPKTICVSCIGSDMGKSVITTRTSVTNQQINSVIINEEHNYMYVYYLMRTLENTIKSLGKNGTAVPILSKSKFSGIDIQVHDLESQCRIAIILSGYDDLIENNQKQIKLLEEAAQRLYKEWFVDLHFPGHENTPVIDGVPHGWKNGILDDIVFESGKNEKKENRENYSYYLPIDCLPKQSIGYTDTSDICLAESSLVAFSKNDIIFGAMRPYFHKVVIARDSGLTRSTCFVLNSRQNEFWSYLAMLMFSKDTVDYATQISVGTTMPYARWKDLKQMPVIIPSKIVAEKFQSAVKPIIEKIGCLSKEIISLRQARDILLPKLMSGELEV